MAQVGPHVNEGKVATVCRRTSRMCRHYVESLVPGATVAPQGSRRSRHVTRVLACITPNSS